MYEVLRPLYFGLQGNKNLTITLKSTFKIEGLSCPQALVYWLYDALIAFILCTTKMGFQFWEQIEVGPQGFGENGYLLSGSWGNYFEGFGEQVHSFVD